MSSKPLAIAPLVLIVLGLALLIYMVMFESEPGGIPVLMVLVGLGWLVVRKFRSG